VRRATAAILGTVVGTTLVVGAKYATRPVSVTADPVAGEPAGADPASGTEPSGPGAQAAPSTTGAAKPGAAPTTGRPAPPGVARTTAPPSTNCSTVTGAAKAVSSPGVGSVTVTIKVCNGAITSASGSLSRSNWGRNSQAIPSLNSMAVKYYKTDISKIHYSGATLTSNAYQNSLRAAMSQAGI